MIPVWVGVGVAVLATKTGIVLDASTAAAVGAAASGIVTTAYYTAVRLAEAKWPWLGWLLGSATPPTYGSPKSTTDTR
jgi:hypothetical protein